MSKNIPLFEYPETFETFDVLLDKLLNETARGAVLIGTSHVEEHLENLILRILPSDKKQFTTKLFNYPGSLSSFSAKIELSYAFRLISEDTYSCLNHLRKIRNEAAHSAKEFSLADKELDEVFDLGPGFKKMVNDVALEMMMKTKMQSIKRIIGGKEGMKEEEINEQIVSLFNDEKNIEKLDKQLPHWKLVFGLSIVCGMLRFYSDQTHEKIKDAKTWSDIK